MFELWKNEFSEKKWKDQISCELYCHGKNYDSAVNIKIDSFLYNYGFSKVKTFCAKVVIMWCYV